MSYYIQKVTCQLHDLGIIKLCINSQCKDRAACCEICVRDHCHANDDYIYIKNIEDNMNLAQLISIIHQLDDQIHNYKQLIQPILQELNLIAKLQKCSQKQIFELFNRIRQFLCQNQQGQGYCDQLLINLNQLNNKIKAIINTIEESKMPKLSQYRSSEILPNIHQKPQYQQQRLFSCVSNMKQNVDIKDSHQNLNLSFNQLPQQDNIKRLLEKARRLQQEQQYKQSISIADKVLELQSTASQAYFIKAECLMRSSNFQKAIEISRKGLEYDKNNLIALCNLTDSLIKIQNYDEAFAILDDILKLNPGDKFALELKEFQTYTQLAEILLKLSKLNDSLKYAEQVINRFDSYQRPNLVKAQILFVKKEYNRAEIYFKKVLKSDPNNKRAIKFLKDLQLKQQI